MPYRPCTPRGCTRKPVITSSKISTAPYWSHSARRPSRKPGAGMMRFMLPAIGSTMIAAIRRRLGRERGGHGGEVVVGHDDRQFGDRRRHAGRRRLPERERAGSRLHQQAVAVAVVAAFELQDLRAARVAAREAQRGHRRLGAGRHEPHQFERRAAGESASRPSRSRSRSGAPNERPWTAVSCTARTTAGWAWPRIAGPHEPT